MLIKQNQVLEFIIFCDERVMIWHNFARRILVEINTFHKIKLIKAANYCTFEHRPKYSVLENTKSIN